MKYVILGSSAAGMNAVKEIRRLDKEGTITLISKDENIYSRCILHHYLGNIRTVEQLSFVEKDFMKKYDVEWMGGAVCSGINCKDKEAILEDGRKIYYDKLLIATGARTFVPSRTMEIAKNSVGFRNLDDIEKIKKMAAEKPEHVVVMGAGLVGLDAVSGLLELGVKPVVLDLADRPLVRQLDKQAAKAYKDAFAKEGVQQYYGVLIDKLIMDGKDNITDVILSDGRKLPCDYLIMTAGVRSNIGFLNGTELETDKFGLIFDERGNTNVPDIYGAGDVSGRAPIWPAAVKEGIIAGNNMAGGSQQMEDFFASKSTMNFLGVATMSLANPIPEDDTYEVEIEETADTYKKIIHKAGKITGAILQGDLAYSGILQQMIAYKIDVSKVNKSLFDIDYADFFNINENFEYFYEEAGNE